MVAVMVDEEVDKEVDEEMDKEVDKEVDEEMDKEVDKEVFSDLLHRVCTRIRLDTFSCLVVGMGEAIIGRGRFILELLQIVSCYNFFFFTKH